MATRASLRSQKRKRVSKLPASSWRRPLLPTLLIVGDSMGVIGISRMAAT